MMGRFLLNPDNDIRSIALKLFPLAIQWSRESISPYINTIYECANETDYLIKTRALDIICASVNEVNIKDIVKQLLNVLIEAEGAYAALLSQRLCYMIDAYMPSMTWYLDIMVRILAISGTTLDESVIFSTANRILQAKSE
jgi:AP-1 complex subunit gamma-1